MIYSIKLRSIISKRTSQERLRNQEFVEHQILKRRRKNLPILKKWIKRWLEVSRSCNTTRSRKRLTLKLGSKNNHTNIKTT
jgi:transposase